MQRMIEIKHQQKQKDTQIINSIVTNCSYNVTILIIYTYNSILLANSGK